MDPSSSKDTSISFCKKRLNFLTSLFLSLFHIVLFLAFFINFYSFCFLTFLQFDIVVSYFFSNFYMELKKSKFKAKNLKKIYYKKLFSLCNRRLFDFAMLRSICLLIFLTLNSFQRNAFLRLWKLTSLGFLGVFKFNWCFLYSDTECSPLSLYKFI